MTINKEILKYGLLAALVLGLLKITMFASQNLQYKFNPIFTIGTFGILLFSVLQLYGVITKIRSFSLWTLLIKGMTVLSIALAISLLIDQIAYVIKPQFAIIIKNLTIAKSQEASAVLKIQELDKQLEILKSKPLSNWVGVLPFIRDYSNYLFINILWLLPFTAIYIRIIKSKPHKIN